MNGVGAFPVCRRRFRPRSESDAGTPQSPGTGAPCPAAPFCWSPIRASATASSSRATCRWRQRSAPVWRSPAARSLPGGHRVFTAWEEAPPFDAWATLSSLPGLSGTVLGTIPAPIPYLLAEPERVEHWKGRLDGLLPRGYRRVGLVWAGRPTHGNDRNRSMPLTRLSPFFALEKTVLVSLQKGPAQAEVAQVYGAAPLVNLGPELESFADTMAVLAQLDHMVCVDTAIAHLAGAMGRPTAVLLPHAPDWRWLLGRGGTPWYPTVTLHRQPAPGCWDEAVRGAVAAVTGGTLRASGRPARR